MSETLFHSGRVELRPQERRLLVDGTPQPLGARAFDLLVVLVERRDRVVTKRELLDLVWPDAVVEESNLPVHVSALRKALGVGAVATIPGRGYQFTLDADADTAPPPAHDLPRSPLPDEVDPLVGREEAVYELVAELANRSLVTIVGAGGIGKTRLARAVQRRLREDFVDGVWWVDLAPVQAPESVAEAIAQAVGEPLDTEAVTDGPNSLAAALAHRGHMLLVLDNCEHVADGVAAVVATLQAVLPTIRLLLTSRAPLHLAAEQVWRLEALSVPDPRADLDEARACAAFHLFELRARSADHRFAINAGNLRQAVELCRRLEGHPLAIEMAAARAPQIGLGPLLERLGERLRMLRASDPAQPDRQSSLRATLDWSCSQLDQAARVVLRRAAVFTSSFGLEAVQRVAVDDALDEWDVLDALAALVDHSLVQVLDETEAGAAPRYRLAETTRLYASEQLQAADDGVLALRGHSHAMAGQAEAALATEWSSTRAGWMARFWPDRTDLQIAFDAACTLNQIGVAATTGAALSALDSARGQVTEVGTRVAAARALLSHGGAARDVGLLWNLVAPGWSAERPVFATVNEHYSRVEAWRGIDDAPQSMLALRDLIPTLLQARQVETAGQTADAMRALDATQWAPALQAELSQIDAALFPYRAYETGRDGLLRAMALLEPLGDAYRVAEIRLRLAELATAARVDAAPQAPGQPAPPGVRRHRPVLLGGAWVQLAAARLDLGDDEGARQAAAEAYQLLRVQPGIAQLHPIVACLAARFGKAKEAAQLQAATSTPDHGAVVWRQATTADRLWRLAIKALGGVRVGPSGDSNGSADALTRNLLGIRGDHCV